MSQTKIDGNGDIQSLTIKTASVASDAGIEETKLSLNSLDVTGRVNVGKAPTSPTTLSVAMTVSDTTATVVSTSGYPSKGTVVIADGDPALIEAIDYTGITATTFTGLTRGRLGTSASAHPSGKTVRAVLLTALNTATSVPGMISTQNGSVGFGVTPIDNAIHIHNADPSLRLTRVDGIGDVRLLTGSSASIGTKGGTSNFSIEAAGLIAGTFTATTLTLRIGGAGTAALPAYTFVNDQDTGIWNPSANVLAISTLGAERVRVTSAGDVGIGLVPTKQLELSLDSAQKPTTNTWTITSDKRIKRDINDFKDGLSIVNQIRPISYKLCPKTKKNVVINDTSKISSVVEEICIDENRYIGIIAQELELIAPYMVETGKGFIAGKMVDDMKFYQGHAMTFVLVNAIKELSKKVDKLYINR